MLERLYRRKKRSRDIRFVDAEVYRAQRQPPSRPTSSPLKSERDCFRQDGLFVNYLSSSEMGREVRPPKMRSESISVNASPRPVSRKINETEVDRQAFLTDEANERLPKIDDDVIVVDKTPVSGQTLDLLDFAILESRKKVELEASQRRAKASADRKKPTQKEKHFAYSLGVFSDSKMYSAMIREELMAYDLDIKHFNHPNTFVRSKYKALDQISVWILFLSDECDEAFLEQFIERYYDKPTLFLCPKMTRKNATSCIEAFVMEHELEKFDIVSRAARETV